MPSVDILRASEVVRTMPIGLKWTPAEILPGQKPGEELEETGHRISFRLQMVVMPLPAIQPPRLPSIMMRSSSGQILPGILCGQNVLVLPVTMMQIQFVNFRMEDLL